MCSWMDVSESRTGGVDSVSDCRGLLDCCVCHAGDQADSTAALYASVDEAMSTADAAFDDDTFHVMLCSRAGSGVDVERSTLGETGLVHTLVFPGHVDAVSTALHHRHPTVLVVTPRRRVGTTTWMRYLDSEKGQAGLSSS